MATQQQRVFNDNYRLELYRGDQKQLTVGIYNDFYRTDPKDLSGYTAYLKTEVFTVTGTTYGDDNNLVLFILSNSETNQVIGNYPYEIFILDSTGERETIVQDYLEIMSIV